MKKSLNYSEIFSFTTTIIKSYFLKKAIFGLMFVLFCLYGISQQQSELFGLNPELYSGQLYSFKLNKKTSGNQYFDSPEFKNGYAILNGKKFSNILLNIDVVNELPLLQFTNKSGLTGILILPFTQLDEFSIDNKQFTIYTSENDSIKKIYQVIGKGKFEIYCHREKRITTASINDYNDVNILEKPKKNYLKMNDKLFPYSNKSSFIKLFPKENQSQIKVFMKEKGINRVKDMDLNVQALIDYCNTLIR